MSESLCVVSSCGRPRRSDQWLCGRCEHRLERRLADVPALWQELEITMTRQDVMGSDDGRKNAESGLPYKPSASEARWVLANTIGTWARLIAEHAGISQPPARPARWLLINTRSIALHPAADEAFDEICSSVRMAYRAIDRLPDLLLAGQCEGCTALLYARITDATVTCRECDTEHETAERYEAMIDAAKEYLVPASVALSWISRFLGKSIPRGTWDSWTSRQRLQSHGVDIEGRPTYVFGDAWELAGQWAEWQKQRRAGKQVA